MHSQRFSSSEHVQRMQGRSTHLHPSFWIGLGLALKCAASSSKMGLGLLRQYLHVTLPIVLTSRLSTHAAANRNERGQGRMTAVRGLASRAPRTLVGTWFNVWSLHCRLFAEKDYTTSITTKPLFSTSRFPPDS